MTASQFTGGSFKHVDPSNYSTGKSGSEVTIHWCVRDGADGDEQTRMGELARVEAIRLAMGADRPYTQQAAAQPPVGVVGSNATVASPVVPVASPPTNVVQMPVAQPVDAGPTVAVSVIGAATTDGASTASISDEALLAAATHHSNRVMAAAPKDAVSQELAETKVSGVIQVFVKPPLKLFSIPQEQRQQFIDALAAL